jgi:membrane dipeptidase
VRPDGYSDWTVVDGLELSRWDRELFAELRDGGVSCINATCAFWETPSEAFKKLASWLRTFRDHRDLITPVRRVSDIEEARRRGLVGIMLGFQNASPVADDLDLVAAFHSLGVRVLQLTYNNQNYVGSSCYESSDAGLSRFGRLLVRELNDVGMVIDLSHVGERTSLDAIECSRVPVAITHANPRWFHDVPRNKTDLVLRSCADSGGVVGVCIYPLVMSQGADCTWPAFRDMVLRLIDELGVEHVGFGTDFARGQPAEFISWLRSGTWTRVIDQPEEPAWPEWLSSPREFPMLAGRLMEAGLSEQETRAVMGENWRRLFGVVEAEAV